MHRDRTFNIDDGAEAYNELIVILRYDLAALGMEDRIEHVPTLPSGRSQIFDITLTASGTHTITARFRTNNLYLIGYRSNNTWYQVLDSGPLINEPGTTHVPLPFGGEYGSLTAPGFAEREIPDTPLSYHGINQAIANLATRVPQGDVRECARAFLTLAFAFSEAIRFRAIASRMYKTWGQNETAGVLAGLVTNWNRLSNDVPRFQNARQDFDTDGSLTRMFNQLPGYEHVVQGTASFGAAIDLLGIMRPRDRSRHSSSIPSGQPLLEIYNVRVNKFDSRYRDSAQLYGSITVDDGAGSEPIWKRDSANSLTISPEKDIPLEGPSRPLYAADAFYINVDLWVHFSPDDILAQHTIAFNPFDYYIPYDVVTSFKTTGKNGEVLVRYVAISDALYAKIQVILMGGDREDPADVYGDITANNGFEGGRPISTLFSKPSGEPVKVSPTQPITLSKSVVAVPTDKTLIINAKLWDHDTIGSDKEIASGSVEFQPLYKQSQYKFIAGGMVRVMVTWM